MLFHNLSAPNVQVNLETLSVITQILQCFGSQHGPQEGLPIPEDGVGAKMGRQFSFKALCPDSLPHPNCLKWVGNWGVSGSGSTIPEPPVLAILITAY